MFNLKDKQLKILLLLALIVIVLLIIYILLKPNNANINVAYSKQDTCSNPIEFLTEDDYSIYTYCLDNLYIRKNNILTEFKEYYQNNHNLINNLIKKSKEIEIYKDGGSIKYQYDNLTIIKCHTINGNKDIYLGPKNMEYENSFCQNEHSNQEQYVIYGYFVLNISPSNDEQYLYLTLREFQKDEVVTVKVATSIFNAYEENKYYEFTFKINKDSKTDTILNLFNTSVLTQVMESDNFIK